MQEARAELGGRAIERRTYRMDEVARLFGVGRNQVYEAARRGDFPTIRLGKRLVAPRAAIDRMLGIAE